MRRMKSFMVGRNAGDHSKLTKQGHSVPEVEDGVGLAKTRGTSAPISVSEPSDSDHVVQWPAQ